MASFSSSLCGANGDGSRRFSTATYSVRLLLRSYDDISSQVARRATSLLAVKNRYLPSRLKAGAVASLRPSLTATRRPLGRWYSHTVRMWLGICWA